MALIKVKKLNLINFFHSFINQIRQKNGFYFILNVYNHKIGTMKKLSFFLVVLTFSLAFFSCSKQHETYPIVDKFLKAYNNDDLATLKTITDFEDSSIMKFKNKFGKLSDADPINMLKMYNYRKKDTVKYFIIQALDKNSELYYFMFRVIKNKIDNIDYATSYELLTEGLEEEHTIDSLMNVIAQQIVKYNTDALINLIKKYEKTPEDSLWTVVDYFNKLKNSGYTFTDYDLLALDYEYFSKLDATEYYYYFKLLDADGNKIYGKFVFDKFKDQPLYLVSWHFSPDLEDLF